MRLGETLRSETPRPETPLLRQSLPQDAIGVIALGGRRAASAALVSGDPALEIAEAIASTAQLLGVGSDEIAPAILDRALVDARFFEIAPATALQAQVELAAAITGVSSASLWVEGEQGSIACLGSSSGSLPARRLKVLARNVIEHDAPLQTGVRSPALGVPVRRFGVVHAVLVVRLGAPDARAGVEALVREAANRISAVVERHQLLVRAEARERTLVGAAERRLVRTGYDLHDGPLQLLASLGEELRLFADDVLRLIPAESRDSVAEGLASITQRVGELDEGLREVAQSLETTVVARRSLGSLVQREAEVLARKSGITVVSDVRADFDGLSDSQRIALYRVVQEALSNAARHSGASEVRIRIRSTVGGITMTVADDGRGFDSTSVLAAASGRGRLGLVGIAERIRLLGGSLNVTSAPGAGTRVRVVLARWSAETSGVEDYSGASDSP